MEQEQVVDGVMLDFNTYFPLVPEEMKTHVRYLFNLVWMAGWEERARELGGHNLKPVQQLDRYGNVLHTYPSLKDAALDVGYLYDTLQRAINKGSLTHHGRFLWRFIDSIEGVSKVKKEDGLLNAEVVTNTKIDILPPCDP